MMKLARLQELVDVLTRSSTAAASGLGNQPAGIDAARLYWVALWVDPVLDVLRAAGFQAVHPSSGYRSPAVNALLPGASSTSYHQHGLAFDVGGVGVWSSCRQAARALRRADPWWLGAVRTVIAEDDHVHLDFWDPFHRLTESRSATRWLEQSRSGGFVALSESEA